MLPHTLVCGPTDGELSFVAATAPAITESMSSTVGKLLDMAKTRADSSPRQPHKTLASESGPWAKQPWQPWHR